MMIMRGGGECQSFMRPTPLWWGMQSPPLTTSSVVHLSPQNAGASHSTRVG